MKKSTLTGAAISASVGLFVGALINREKIQDSYSDLDHTVRFYVAGHKHGRSRIDAPLYDRMLLDDSAKFVKEVGFGLLVPAAAGGIAAILLAGPGASAVSRILKRKEEDVEQER